MDPTTESAAALSRWPGLDDLALAEAPGLRVHRGDRADLLLTGLVAELADPLPDPFATEVVAVSSPGMERWVAQGLSERLGVGPGGSDGICAGVSFPTVERMLAGVVEEVLGRPGWQPVRLVPTVLTIFDEVADEPWFTPVRSHLGGGGSGRPGRRYATARRIALRFGRYLRERPGLLAGWSAGSDEAPPDLGWQPPLWRALVARSSDPVAEVTEVARALLADPGVATLPPRLAVVGPSRLDLRQRTLLAALATHRDLGIWLPHSSATAWQAVAARSIAGPRRAEHRSPARHRLTVRLGRDQEELQLVLGDVAVDHLDLPSADGTVLERLQSAIRADRPAPLPAERPTVAPDDSIQLHSSHGPARQVEVLREVLLGLLAADPDLEPRDILVMCPDIDTYAPLIQAAFGVSADSEDEPDGSAHPGHRLEVKLADRAQHQTNPMVALLLTLLDLPAGRAGAGSLIDLCALPAVSARFGFDADAIARIGELVHGSGIRWGLDPQHRSSYGLGDVAQNTWSAGVQRMLLGVAMGEDDEALIGTVIALDGIESSEVELVGNLAELIGRVRDQVRAIAVPRPLAEWITLTREALESLTSTDADDAWQLPHVLSRLQSLVPPAEPGQPLAAADFRALVAAEFSGRPSRNSFRTGSLTICTLSPMRSVPHPVICLLGVDDGVFPRRRLPDGDDLVARDPWLGDADPAAEERQLLLDAVLAAQRRLVVVHGGHDPRTGEERPLSVPLREVLDAIDETVRPIDGDRPMTRRLTTDHGLQPWSARNFQPPVRSFDRIGHRAALLGGERPRQPAPFDPATLAAAAPPSQVTVGELARFLHHPGKEWWRQRFGWTEREVRAAEEEIPLMVSGLERWAVGSRILGARLDGVESSAVAAAERVRGELPPRALGTHALNEIGAEVEQILQTSRVQTLPPSTSADLGLQLDVDGTMVGLSGVVGDLRGESLARVRFGKLGERHLISAWIDLLLLCAADTSTSWRLQVHGSPHSYAPPLTMGPVEPGRARALLTDLLRIHRAGLRQPLPVPIDLGRQYVTARQNADDVAARRRIATRTRYLPDKPVWDRILGGHELEDFVRPAGDPERAGEFGCSHLFGQVALSVWGPFLAHQRATGSRVEEF